jgi:hypothetical protein
VSRAEQRACQEIGALLVFYVCGETNEQESARIDRHLTECAACSSQLTEERSLHESLMEALKASEKFDSAGILLSQCRSELAEGLDELAAPRPKESWRPFGWLRRSMVLRPMVSGALLVLAGVVIGTELLPWIGRQEPGAGVQTVRVSPSKQLTDEQLAKMAVAAVNLAPSADGVTGNLQVHMRTEEPLVLSGSVDDPEMRRVLTYVVENGQQADPGVKLDCLEALRLRTRDQDVRRALLYAARNDQNPAVRMKAMDSLRDSVSEAAVRDTLIGALEHDANPGVRVEAVNLLVRSLQTNAQNAQQAAAPVLAPTPQIVAGLPNGSLDQVVRALQELQRSDPSPNVRLRSTAALRQIGPYEAQQLPTAETR